MDVAAFHGLAGDVVRAYDSVTEADPSAILVALLTAFGNIVGHSPHWCVGETLHHTNLFAVLVGPTSRGRKGTAGNIGRKLLQTTDELRGWRVSSGLTSGEGLIYGLRDKRLLGTNKKGEEIWDDGVVDKRVLIEEPEFANVLTVARREGNTLMSVLRQSWDGDVLGSMARKDGGMLSATDTHVSLLGHITPEELQSDFAKRYVTNGVGNRILWVWSESDKCLPEGQTVRGDVRNGLVLRLRTAVNHGKTVKMMPFTTAAASLWGTNEHPDGIYSLLHHDVAGLAGKLQGRAAPMIRRIACIYALLDNVKVVDVQHINAAMAVWTYNVATIKHVWGNMLGDALAEDLLVRLQNAGPDGMTRAAICDALGRHRSQADTQRALKLLETLGLAVCKKIPTSGRPKELWLYLQPE